MDVAEAASVGGKSGAVPPPVQEGPQRAQEENGAADRLSEKSDASFAAAEPNRAPSGKLKKTAFRFFGGKRSICTLPSFFGGKSKGPGKSASKKGLSKSRTHDGISDVGCEEAGSGQLPSPLGNRVGFPSSQSALLGTEAGLRGGPVWPSASLSGSSEGFEKPGGGEKSSFPSRPKKGLRGFFNSIRRHRKSKTAEPERTELQDWTARGDAAGERAQAGGAEPLRASEKGARQSTALSAEGGEKSEGGAPLGRAGGLADSRDEPGGINGSGSCGEGARATTGDHEGSPEVEVSPDSALCDLSAFGDPPDPLEREDLDGVPPGIAPNDQLSLLFGDVASLQSFDSLTGCGDIIAEPDMDTLTEGSTSADRSKEGAKRNSCLVTYQGGGEEMALPEEGEEYLQQMWEGPAGQGDPAYEARLPERVTESEPPGVNGAEAETRLSDEGTGHEVDLLTPHSDQQESAPNSDEGYYDSATPGPEEDAGEGLLGEVKKERLPRDSYSGDALYEFYEPDDVLMSPSHGEEPWFERKGSPPEIFGRFFDFSLPGEKDLVRRLGQKREGTETEEERLAAIQKQLLYWEMQREPALKHLERFSQDQPVREKPPSEGQTRVASFIGKTPSGLGYEEVAPHVQSSGLKAGIPTQSQDWKDLQEMLLPGRCLAPFLGNGSVSDAEAEQALLESCALGGLAVEKSGAYPFYRTHSGPESPTGEPPNRSESDFGEPRPGSGCELEQEVNFSQALVEFTSSGTLFSSLSESLGSSDSGSVFTQNLPGLPTMVTFDIVDVEHDGEGECEQHLEMTTDEDMAASFEAFAESYLPKESFAECDERLFPGCPRSSFQSCNWGIASLPRHLHLQELSPPGPELLSGCRRSRSLDTESLEFELAGLQLPRNGFKPCELWSPRGVPKKGPGSLQWSVGRASAPCSPEEKEGDAGALSWPGLQKVPSGKGCSSPEAKPWNGDRSTPSFPSTWAALEQLDAEVPPRSPDGDKAPSREPRADGGGHPGLPGTKPTPRPSNLPLPMPIMAWEGCLSHRAGGDREAQMLAWVLPLGEKGADLPAGFEFPGLDTRNVSAAQQGERSPL